MEIEVKAYAWTDGSNGTTNGPCGAAAYVIASADTLTVIEERGFDFPHTGGYRFTNSDMTDDGQELGQSSGTINQHIKREITSIRSELRKNRAAIRKSVNSNESYWASQAMLRFDEAGGTLKLLTDAHEYGNA